MGRIVGWIYFEFRIPIMGERSHVMSKNLKSSAGMGHFVKKKITQELKENRVAGPFSYVCDFLP